MIRFIYISLLLSFHILLLAQNVQHKVTGYITLDVKRDIFDQITVMNKTTEEWAFSDVNGVFSIYAAENDTLRFTAVFVEEKKYVVTAQNIENKRLFIRLNSFVNMVDEVVVTGMKLTGDLEEDIRTNRPLLKSYRNQQLEEKIGIKHLEKEPQRSATGPIMPSIAGIPIPLALNVSNLLDVISGNARRRAEWYKEKEESEETRLIREYFPDDFYQTNLGIPPDKISEFVLYVYYYTDIKQLVDERAFDLIQLRLINSATEFLRRVHESESAKQMPPK